MYIELSFNVVKDILCDVKSWYEIWYQKQYQLFSTLHLGRNFLLFVASVVPLCCGSFCKYISRMLSVCAATIAHSFGCSKYVLYINCPLIAIINESVVRWDPEAEQRLRDWLHPEVWWCLLLARSFSFGYVTAFSSLYHRVLAAQCCAMLVLR